MALYCAKYYVLGIENIPPKGKHSLCGKQCAAKTACTLFPFTWGKCWHKSSDIGTATPE